MMDVEQIRKGIEPYAHERAVLLRLLRKRGGSFTAPDFDRWFVGLEFRRPHNVKLKFLPEDGFILGVGRNGGTIWARTLHLLQILCALEDVEECMIDDVVVYTLKVKV